MFGVSKSTDVSKPLLGIGDDGWVTAKEPIKKSVIENWERFGDYLVVQIKYLGHLHFEGCKILIFKDASIFDLRESIFIDPHFSPTNKLIARFRPGKQGWIDAEKFCKAMQ